jgi:thymidylate synthase (FAD)
MIKEMIVLDKGFVRLVSYMQPAPALDLKEEAQVQDRWTGDLEVVRNARVSYDADWRTGDDADKDERLMRFMYTHGHTSPYEAMVFTFEVKAPIFVLRQWHRHRTWSYNELSARYAPMQEDCYVPYAHDIGVQSKDNKQCRDIDGEVSSAAIDSRELIMEANAHGHRVYRALLEKGVPRELARIVLPVSTYSRMFATVDLHNLMKFLGQRLHPHAQFEICCYAEAILGIVKEICPVAITEFWRQHNSDGMMDDWVKKRGWDEQWMSSYLLGDKKA